MAKEEWEHLRTFLEAAKSGSFTQASRELGVSQPTVSRRMEELEELVGGPLFIRHSRGLRLTDRGAALYESAQGLDHEVKEIFRRVRRDPAEPEGVVRLSVNEPIAAFALPPALRRLRQQYPKITLEIVVENATADLTRRAADIAVRMFEPQQGELIAQYLGEIEIGFFASEQYLQSAPLSSPLEGPGHTVLGMDSDPSWERFLRAYGLSRDMFQVRTDNLILTAFAARAGVGIIGTHVQIGEELGLLRLPAPIAFPPYPVWLVRHEALRNDLAVRVVNEELARTLRAYIERTASARC